MKSYRNTFCIIVLFAALCVLRNAAAAEARAWLDRNSMQLGETVTLNVELADSSSAGQPDFSALQQEFNLIGTSSSSSMSIANGRSSAKVVWAVGLEPKRAGTLTIPALSVGGAATQPLTLSVLPQAAGASGKAGDDVFIEISAEPLAPYVQQQMRCTVKLYYALNLTEGNLEDPRGDGLVTQKLGQDKSYEANVGGQRYRVIERHYALTPERSGALTLPAVAFRGRALESGNINSFFSRGKSVGARSDAIALQVRPRPTTAADGAWLPAQSLRLTVDGLDSSTSGHVGEPITLTLRVQAQGLGFEQLPELKLPAIDVAQIYPDKPVTRNRDDGNWLYGEVERKFAIVPTRAGKLALPALSLSWWDTANDREQTAEIAPAQITILPAASAAPVASAVAAPDSNIRDKSQAAAATSPPPTAVAAAAVGAANASELQRWRALALVALALWAFTLGAWSVRLRRQRRELRDPRAQPPQLPVDSSAAGAAFRESCKSDDLAAAARALLVWARAERPALRNLADLRRALTDPAQIQALSAMERTLYADGRDDVSPQALVRVFQAGCSFQRIQNGTAQAAALPPLYPFRL